MSRLFTIFISGLLLVVTSGCFGKKTEVQAANGGSSTQSSSVPIKWSAAATTGSGIDLRISAAIATEISGNEISGLDPVEQMGQQWNNSVSTLTFFKVPANSTTDSEPAAIASYEDGVFGIYRHNTWFTGVSSSALAVTQWLGQRRNVGSSIEFIELYEADIIFNYNNFTFTMNSTNTTDFDFHTVLLHEMGHFIGLTHNFGSATSIMTPYLGPSDVIRTVQTVDTSNIQTNYGVSALTALPSSGTVVSALSASDEPSPLEGQKVRGIAELRADGTCVHSINGKFVKSHHVKLR